MFFALALIVLFCTTHGIAASGTPEPALIAGVTSGEALRLGEQMYREGVLPSGEQMQSIVQGDIPVVGGNFTCTNCHQRSGFGSAEGLVRTTPIDGTRLFLPLSKFKGIPVAKSRRSAMIQNDEELYRPAYTDETLARVMRTGEDSKGRQISDTMPKYLLDGRDMEILIYYLKNLSSVQEPGVTDETLHLATVITDEVPKEDREAMLGPLQFYISNWRLSRQMERSARSGAYLQEGTAQALRAVSLTVWDLKGPAESWQTQLEEYYRKGPVFALVGGITTGEWAPIHRFCEKHKIPSVFPITDFPVISDTDWYTLYLSKGLYQEGETAARFLHGRDELSREVSVVQVFRKDRAGLALSKYFQETWQGLGHKAAQDHALAGNETLTADFWKRLAFEHKNAVLVLWLTAKDFPDLANFPGQKNQTGFIFASSSLLGKRLYTLPDKERKSVYITYPYSLPREARVYRENIAASLKNNKVPITNLDIELKMYSLFSMLSGPLGRMRSYAYRDYFIELLEATPDLSVVPVTYPRLSFGSGQRYASKGCYIVQLTEGPNPELVKKSEWVIH